MGNVVRMSLASPADAFEDNAVQWDSGVPCSDTSDSCLVGFRWLRDQVAGNDMESFATVGYLSYASVAPRCVRLSQSTTVGKFATTVLVQYWPTGASAWLNHTIAQSAGGGKNNFRLPLVPLAQSPR